MDSEQHSECYRSMYMGFRPYADIDKFTDAELCLMFLNAFAKGSHTIQTFDSIDSIFLMAAAAWYDGLTPDIKRDTCGIVHASV